MFRLPSTLVLLALFSSPAAAEKIVPGCRFVEGPINGVLLERDGRRLAVYGWQEDDAKNIDHVVLPHGRRDLVWNARAAASQGAQVVAPAGGHHSLQRPGEYWNAFITARFHDYAQQTTKIVGRPLPVDREVGQGDSITWQGLELRVLATPGFARGSVSYLTELGGKKLAFTGDLIYGDGQLFDLYSFQDEIPEAQIRGYHGHAARLADLVMSLEKLAAEKPDLLVPARGPVIRDPQGSIERLVARVRAVYSNYLSTNALNWYFKEKRMTLCGRRVLGENAEVELMPYSLHEQTPDWIFEHSTSRLLISESGHTLLLDCGYQRVIDAVQELIDKKIVKQVDGIFVTHFHDDHTDMVQAAAEHFQCPVYATKQYADVLENPGAYHLPALTPNPIHKVQALSDGHRMKWQEFQLTFRFFPGQTYYHGALLVEKPDAAPIFFIGDAFSPSGMDDYCLLNRNLLHDQTGYLRCLRLIHELPGEYWLVNEHIRHIFTFSEEELDYLESRYRDRIELLAELFPWDDPNYGVDEQWAFFYPHVANAAAGEQITLQLRLTNHSPVERTFHVTPHVPPGLKLSESSNSITLRPHERGAVEIRIEAGDKPGNYLVTADVRSGGMDFRRWSEALITIP